jgi:putative Flp pilus-assembly TadE/G-like protein
VVMLGLAALGIDVVTLYVARTETQRAADAAALAGARAFVASGFTSGQLGAVSSSAAQDQVCVNGGSTGTGAANQEAQAVAAQNQIAGQAASVQSILCNFSQPENPRITVSVRRTDLPTFFSRIWGNRGNSVSTTATAEAFNPSGSTVPIQVISVKPWLIPNCNPNQPGLACPTLPYFVDPSSNYSLKTPAVYIGQHVRFSPRITNAAPYPGPGQYYLMDMSSVPGQATVCPSPNTAPATSCSLVGNGGYLDNIACGNRNELTCGSTVQLHNGPPSLLSDTIAGTQCLIHTLNASVVASCADPSPDCFVVPGSPGSPVIINGGQSNPNTALQNVSNISRSDSIITVPIVDGTSDLCNPSCSSGPNPQVIGFLQLGIEYVTTPDAEIGAVILNAVGCDPAATGTAVSGSGVTPIPVRLIHN